MALFRILFLFYGALVVAGARPAVTKHCPYSQLDESLLQSETHHESLAADSSTHHNAPTTDFLWDGISFEILAPKTSLLHVSGFAASGSLVKGAYYFAFSGLSPPPLA